MHLAVLGQPPVRLQPRKAPVPPSDPPPDELPEDDPEDEPEDEPDDEPEPDPDDEPELDPDEEPDEEPDDDPEDEPDDDPDDEPESGPAELPASASFPSLPALLEQAPNAKAAASSGTPSNHRPTMRASVGECSPLHEACLPRAVEVRRALSCQLRTSNHHGTEAMPRAPRPETPTRHAVMLGVSAAVAASTRPNRAREYVTLGIRRGSTG